MIAALVLAVAGFAADTIEVTPDGAAARAVQTSPIVASAVGALAIARGIRAESRWPFPSNPQVEFGRVRRQSSPGIFYDREWSVGQEVELGGQFIGRNRASSALERAGVARVDDARRLVALGARRAVASLAVAHRRAALTDSAAQFADRLAGFATKQFDAGEINRLERNIAILDAARARSAAERAASASSAAAAELGRLLGLPRDTAAVARPLEALPQLRWSSDDRLIELAREHRPDLLAAREFRLAADRFARLARLDIMPTLSLNAFSGREAGTDRLLGVSAGVSIPLFRRQQAAIGEADAARSTASADVLASERAVIGEVIAAGAKFAHARAAEQRFASDVLRAAAENVTLTERALAEGEVSLTDVLVLRTTAVATQLEYLEVLREAFDAWFELAAALGVEPARLSSLLTAGN